MIRLGIVSDSHGRSLWLERFAAVAIREKYDKVFHLGDIREDAKWLERALPMPVISVAGNCDGFSHHAREVRVSLGLHSLLAVHGDLYGVKYGLERLSYHAEEIGAGIALFGHTHLPYAGFMGSAMLINPGALREGCYGELKLEGDQAIPMLKTLRSEI